MILNILLSSIPLTLIAVLLHCGHVEVNSGPDAYTSLNLCHCSARSLLSGVGNNLYKGTMQ